MFLSERVEAIRLALLSLYPLPFTESPGATKEEAFRHWCVRFAQQLAYSEPAQGWGVKRADSSRPISKDTICRQLGGRLYIWDLFTGVGSAHTVAVERPESQDVTGQYFDAEASVAADSLHDRFPPAAGAHEPPSPAELADALSALAARVAALEAWARSREE
jgi:hypothetical protein